jgi:hypothetical protein
VMRENLEREPDVVVSCARRARARSARQRHLLILTRHRFFREAFPRSLWPIPKAGRRSAGTAGLPPHSRIRVANGAQDAAALERCRGSPHR